MKIRPLEASDIDSTATVCAAAWLESPINEYLYPDRRRHPKAYHKLYARGLKIDVLEDEETFAVIAETESSDDIWTGNPEILGYVSWEMNESEEKNKSLGKRVRDKIKQYDIRGNFLLLLNHGASSLHNLSYGNKDPVFFAKTDEEPDERLEMAYIAVDPKYQKKGIGLCLVREVLQHADKEKLPVTLYSLYLKAGFKQIGKWQSADAENMWFLIMRWDPPVVQEH